MIKAVDSVTLVRVNDGAKGNPTGITVSSTEPSSKYTGMLWKCTGNISGKIQNATYRWNGSSWELYVFKAANIDVNDLFAQNITAKHMTIEGDSTFSGELKAASGTFAGEMKADSINITSTGGNRHSFFEMNKNGMDIISNVTTATSTDGDYFTQCEIKASGGNLEFDVANKFNNKSSGVVATLASGKAKMSSSELDLNIDIFKLNNVDVGKKMDSVTDLENSVTALEKKVNTLEPKITRSNAGVYYKDGYTCHLHAWWVDATSVFFTLGANFRPKSLVTCVGFCQRKDNAAAYPLMCELEPSGAWQVWAMTGIGVSGGQSMWVVYQPTNGIDHRSEFTVCVTGSWLTNSNGG